MKEQENPKFQNPKIILDEGLSLRLRNSLANIEAEENIYEKNKLISLVLMKLAETLSAESSLFVEVIKTAIKADLDTLEFVLGRRDEYQEDCVNHVIGHHLFKNVVLAWKSLDITNDSALLKLTEFLAKAYEGYGRPNAAKMFYEKIGKEKYEDKIKELDKLDSTLGVHGSNTQVPVNPADIEALLNSLSGDQIMLINTIDFIHDLLKKN